MIVDSIELAEELRRRRVGRSGLVDSLAITPGSAYVPGELEQAPTSLLVLAAMALVRPTSA
ncbi:MAG TPA: hypothetical protein VFB78_05205 [Acidimicrobiales bacterium]|nr:hypothetical protein [Acidimicrobiales bacterium]